MNPSLDYQVLEGLRREQIPLMAKCSVFKEFSMRSRKVESTCRTIVLLATVQEIKHLCRRRQKEVERGRTAGYPTAPAQIPACGFPAPGSS
jgi:diphthamide synthase subunit DPH2